MVCCPFHADRTPSMKLNEDYFYCFGCGASGDVIDLAARLFGLSSYDAAKKLAADFGVAGQKPSILAKLQRGNSQAEAERRCFRVLGTTCKSCRTGRRIVPRNRRRTPSTRAMRRPAICSSASGICWTFWPAARPQERGEVVADLQKDDRLMRMEARNRQIREDEHGTK